ncbi:beta-phosphoglucomutase [Paenibacillus sp. FSL K6-1096]|uniref:beta-phosphoglucomutase n=1 Tax=Paenibacillus sp. FSL K6-1096 TaxID=2921460 RepID=UPI0030EC30B7
MADTRIEAVVFDLDGVITDTARFHYAAWKQLAGQLGITIDEAFNERLKGVSRMDSLEEILREGGQQDRFSLEEKEQLASEKNEQYCRLLTQLTPEDVLPGIPEFIASIKAAGIPVGLASVSRNAGTVLESLQLGPVFDYIADAALIRNSKPDPEIFLTACAGLGADPRYSIGVEDAPAGIQAINASGMFAVGVGKQLPGADYLVQSTDQLCWEEIRDCFFQTLLP